MKIFLPAWLGHLGSLLGMQLAGFSLGLWAYQQTGSVMLYGLLLFVTTAPPLLCAPLVGALADRFNRGWLLAIGRVGAAIQLIALALLFHGGVVSPSIVLVCLAIASACLSGEFAIVSAIASQLFDASQLSRINGLLPLGLAISQVVAPPVASFLYGVVSIRTVLLASATAIVLGAVGMAAVRVPSHRKEPLPTTNARPSIAPFMLAPWSYIRSNPGLVWLIGLLAGVHFMLGTIELLAPPLTLMLGDTKTLGNVLTAAGAGMLIGSGLVILLGGPGKQARTIAAAILLQGVIMPLGVLWPSVWLLGAAASGLLLLFPILAASSETLWQLRVPEPLQGRVFSIRNALTSGALPLAHLVGGPMAAGCEKLMAPTGLLSSTLGRLLGTGPGRGIALAFILVGCCLMVAGASALLAPAMKELDSAKSGRALGALHA